MKKIIITVDDDGASRLEVVKFHSVHDFMEAMANGMLHMLETYAHCNTVEAVENIVVFMRGFQRGILEEEKGRMN